MTGDPNKSQIKPPKLTYGMKAVGLTFNPSADPTVDSLKWVFAEVIDLIRDMASNIDHGEVDRMAAIAITHAQTAQMWAVKAATWPIEPPAWMKK